VLLLLSVVIIYYWFFQKSEVVDNGIGKLQTVYKGHKAKVWMSRFSMGDDFIASAGVDSTVQCYSIDGKLIRTLKHPSGVTNFSFSTDSVHLVTASYDELIRIWNINENKVERTLKGHAGTVWTVGYSYDSKLIASGGEDKKLRIWDAATGTKLLKHTV
jgi:WD40 repeat protein